MTEEVEPEEEILLDKNEEQKLKTICDYLFQDQFQSYATFTRFEYCFQPLFNTLILSLDKIFKDICGLQKKYLTYQRLIKAYIITKKRTRILSKDTRTFFNLIMNDLLLQETNSSVGSENENSLIFSTQKLNKNRNFITKIQILTNKTGNIHGMNIEYEHIFKNRMYHKKTESELIVSLDMALNLIDERIIKNGRLVKFSGIKEKFYRDAISHVFGTFNQNTGTISFLGFKCVSGKHAFVGSPCGTGFLFGKFGYKFHQIKIYLNEKGINKIVPVFVENPRYNYFLKNYSNLNLKELDKDENINEENILENADEINSEKIIMTPLIDDNYFLDLKNKDKISGSDFKEIINQTPGTWLLPKSNRNAPRKFLSLNEALRVYDEEKQKRKTIQEKNIIENGSTENQKNEIEQNPFQGVTKLHKCRKLSINTNSKKGASKWNGEISKIDVGSIYGNKDNFQMLRKKLAESILTDIMNKEEDFSDIKNNLIEIIIPDIIELEGKKRNNIQIPNLSQKKIRVHKLKKPNINFSNFLTAPPSAKKEKEEDEIEIEKEVNNRKIDNWEIMSIRTDLSFNRDDLDMDEVERQEMENFVDDESRTVYSDSLQLFKNFSSGFNKDEDNLFGFGAYERYYPQSTNKPQKLMKMRGVYNYSPIINYSCSNHSYLAVGGVTGRNYNMYSNNLNSSITSSVTQRYNCNYLLTTNTYSKDPAKIKEMQNNWKYFTKEIKRVSGVYLLQTIGTILKTIKILKMDFIGKNKASLSEKIKLYKLLEENEAVVEFLSKNKNNNEKIDDINDGEEVEDEFLVPEKNSENSISLNELEEKLKDICILLENKKLREDQRRKIIILKNLYLQQKNIILENEAKKVKDEIIKTNQINLDQIIQNEKTKRKQAEKEQQKYIESIDTTPEEKNESENKNIISIFDNGDLPQKIYRKQLISKTCTAWIDFLFGPERRSLCPYSSGGWVFPEGVSEKNIVGWENYKWNRGEEILDTEKYTILGDNISIDDIVQGNINDGYFLTVIGSLCKYPKTMSKLFYTKIKTKEHVYGINIYLHGKWKLVLLDDYFPSVETYFKKFAFSFSKKNDLWVSLLEKAWAKINGCYAKIASANETKEIYSILTEAYTEQKAITSRNKNEIWKKMIDGYKKGFIMNACSRMNVEEVGLEGGHPYSILGVYEINAGEASEQLIRLRDVFGDNEFSGDWSEQSNLWTPEMKKNVENIERIDGDFFIDLDDFANFYSTVDIVKIHENYITSSIKIKKDKATKCQVIKFRIPRGGFHIYIQLYQKNPRIILRDGTYQKTACCFLILADRHLNYIDSISSNNMHICLEENLDKGDYYLYCDVNYRFINTNKKNHGYNITTYASEELKLENITSEININEYLKKTMISYCKRKIAPKKINGVSTYISKSFNDELPFKLCYFDNGTSSNYKLSIEVKSKEKCFCFYCDEIANEEDYCVIKDLSSKKNAMILVLKYSLTSLFSFNYNIATSEDKLKNKIKEIDKTNKRGNSVKKSSSRINSSLVFTEVGEPISSDSNLIQYVLETKNGYVIGIENTGSKKCKVKLALEGLELTDAAYRGRGSPSFYLDPKERKVFNAVMKKRYSGNLSFQFETH